MKEYIKKFAYASAADGYVISYIPFATSVATNPIQNLVCNRTGKYLGNDNGTVVILPPDSINNEIHYTATSKVTPNKTDVFGTNVTYLPNESEFNETTHEGILKFDNNVTSIGLSAFDSCTDLTSITIPNSVTNIGAGAFFYCTNLTSVMIPNNIISIGNQAFESCTSLTSITIPNSVTSIDDYAFDRCSSLTSIIVENNNSVYDSRNNCNALIETATNTLITGCKNTIIPNSVTSIGKSAFDYCTGLTSIIIPNSVTSIGDHAFCDCIGLTSITIPNGITKIEDHTFYYCNGLTSVIIPDSVTIIGESAFHNCRSLTSVTIPDNVTTIKAEAFRDCNGLTSITCEAITPPTLGTFTFDVKNSPIYVPSQSVETYKANQYWSEYADRIQAIA